MTPRAPSALSKLAGLHSATKTTSLRYLHTSRPGHASLTTTAPAQASFPDLSTQSATTTNSASESTPLACLPLSQVLRTYLITSVSSSPTLLAASSKALERLLKSSTWLTDVERNPIINLALRETFYKQFCAGGDKASTRQCMEQLQKIGYHGVILEYALEVLKDAKSADEAKDVEVWRQGLLDTIDMARPGDFVGLKWSGLGTAAYKRMRDSEDPSPLMDATMREVCEAAYAKSVHLLPAAEEVNTLEAFHKWSIDMQTAFNRGPDGAIVYGTYQAYLRSTAGALSQHMALAKKDGFTHGIKLVRGAYLGSEERHFIWDSAEETHANYDGIAAALLRRRYNAPLTPVIDGQEFPDINLVLATHNEATTRKAQAIRKEQVENGEALTPLKYAQLQGMADEVSCELLAESRAIHTADAPEVLKCTTWGTTTQCLNYLLRRAAENKDAAGRTSESRIAMGKELKRRFQASIGLA
ncbi:Proline dehydrogenase-like protein 2 [Elsinoe fawcettii]|nr:Proline dehydrogenase-like protein 2 [Elsinoe fawcettii]